MIVSSKEILNYIPQRPPMVMVDSLVEATEKRIVSRFTILKGNVFVEENVLKEPGIVENIAQTAAAGVGYKQVTQKLPVKLGFIAAIKNLKIYSLPDLNNQLETIVEVVNEVMDVTIVQGTVMVSGNKIAECELRIFVQA